MRIGIGFLRPSLISQKMPAYVRMSNSIQACLSMISKTLKSAETMLEKANQTFAGKKEGEEKKGEGEGGEAEGGDKVWKQMFVRLNVKTS